MTHPEHRVVGERRLVRRLVLAFLFVAGMGFGTLMRNEFPAPALAQQPNVAVREASSLETRIAVIEERMRGQEIALRLQAEKYEERLLILNNSHARAEQVQAQNKDLCVSKDEFKGMSQWRELMEKRITTIEASGIGASGFSSNARANTLAVLSAVGTTIAVIGFVFMMVTRRRAAQDDGRK